MSTTMNLNDVLASALAGVVKPETVLEYVKLAAENKATKQAKPAAPAVVSVPVVVGGNAKTDAFLLATVKQFQSKPRTDGKPSGTFAVKVHGYLHAAGIPEIKIREAVAGAINRNVISKMGIATKNGTMILYFDAKVRPNVDTAAVTPAVKQAAAAAFGL